VLAAIGVLAGLGVRRAVRRARVRHNGS
jgi:hypothetical protein